jgi:hypothetical protein
MHVRSTPYPHTSTNNYYWGLQALACMLRCASKLLPLPMFTAAAVVVSAPFGLIAAILQQPKG